VRGGSSSRPKSQIGNPTEDTLLPATAAELQTLGIKLREVMVNGGFNPTPTNTALEGENAGLTWPLCDGLIWPHLPSERDPRVGALERGLGGRGRDVESGAVREDPQGL
jgi:hypothetical protein